MELTLKKFQEIQSIDLNPADDGGFVLSISIKTNGKTNMENGWEDKKYVFTKDQEKEAFDSLIKVTKMKMKK